MYDAKKSTWLNPNIEYLFNDVIIEYDMVNAGFNIIKRYSLLNKPIIDSLSRMDKVTRHREIGILQIGNKDLTKELLGKFALMREFFIEANKLDHHRIISVKKDAIYTIGECKHLRHDGLSFVKKSEYTSYIRLPENHNIEIYYGSETMDIKGISDTVLNRHRMHMLEFLSEMIVGMEIKDMSIKRKMRRFLKDYKSGSLDDSYYLEFNNMSREHNPIYNYQKVIVPLAHMMMRTLS